VLTAAERRAESPSDVHIQLSSAPESRKASTSLGFPGLPVAAGALALAIFVIDTFTPFGMAVAVLYVIVVLMAANFCDRRGTLIVGIGCAALTVLAFSISHGTHYESTAFMRCIVSLFAIAITTFLILKNKTAETVLREQANLLDVTHDAIFARDADGVITYWNRGAEELYGWSAAEAVGKVSHLLLRTVSAQPIEDLTARVLDTGRWDGELQHTKRDGTQVAVASRWSLQRSESGRPPAILETNSDVSEEKRAKDALRRSESDLAHVNRVTTLGEMSTSIAHEVSQPIAAIATNAGAALRWLGADPANIAETRQALGRIVKDGDRAGQVISRIRALARKVPPRKERLNVNELIAEVIALARGELERSRVSVRTSIAGDLPAVSADRVQIQQVVLNLMVNAIEAMVGTSGIERREISISSARDGENAILVSVRDSGPGIDPEQARLLFNAFYTTKPGGIGMGLAICRSIIEAHDGKLWTEPSPAPGAEFRFSLPIDQPDG
jgi:PAS domain S-box-containing protein